MGVLENDYCLPKLVAPELSHTCQNLKHTLKPLIPEQEWKEFCNIADEFFKEGGVGEKLQCKLVEWQNDLGNNLSWLRPIWDDRYLAFRGRLPLEMNYGLQLIENCWGNDSLATFIAGLCQVIGYIRLDKIEGEITSQGKPLSMDSIKYLIYTRIPSGIRDNMYIPSSDESMTCAVVRKGHWFILNLTDEHGNIASDKEIKKGLDIIKLKADSMGKSEGIGAITSQIREKSFEARKKISLNPLNRMNLESIEKALFVVCLDEDIEQKGGRALITGDCKNRWFDKSLQIIYSENKINLNFEHAGCDASMWVHILSQVDRYIKIGDIPTGGAPHIRGLKWCISDELKEELDNFILDFNNITNNIAFAQRRIHWLSKEYIKSLGVSPDAFVQILYQATYYKFTNRFASTYESAATRGFYQGRTDGIRSLTQEMADFITALNKKDENGATLLDRFRTAEKAHRHLVNISGNGMGVQRHLAGLYTMYDIYAAQDNIPMPELFCTRGYSLLTTDYISTSSVAGPAIDFFGFAPVTDNGIGIGYGIRKDSLNLMVSSFKDSDIDPDKFLCVLEEIAKELISVIKSGN